MFETNSTYCYASVYLAISVLIEFMLFSVFHSYQTGDNEHS